MISFLKGELCDVTPESVVIGCCGVGYEVFVPSSILQNLPLPGEEIKVYTYLQVREDGVCLFGFLKKSDLNVFKLLISVNGIGPKGALNVLSAMSADDLRLAIISKDAKALSKAPGIGAKTAQRVIMELSDKFSIEDTLSSVTAPNNTEAAVTTRGIDPDAVLALTALGYSESESIKALREVSGEEGHDTASLIKAALRRMV